MMINDNKPFRLTVIGNGAAIPAAGKYHSSQVLNAHNQLFLLDCGEGTQKAMLENGINPQKLKAIFITHLHGDHIYGLFPLLDTLSLSQRAQPLQVFAPKGLGGMINCISNTMYGGRPYPVDFHAVNTTVNRIITDTTYSPEIAEQVKHVDLLYHEASFASADAELAKLNGHSTATEAANIARLAEAKQLLIGHFSMRYKHPSQLVKEAQSIFPATEEAIEGKTYDIETRL